MENESLVIPKLVIEDKTVWQNFIEKAQEAWLQGDSDLTGYYYYEVVTKSRGYLKVIAINFLPEDIASIMAEDYVCQVHLEIWGRIANGTPIENVKALMADILRKRIIDEYRRRHGSTFEHGDAAFWAEFSNTKESGPEETVVTHDTFKGCNSIIEDLPEKEKEVYTLRVTKRLSVRLTAEKLHLTEDQVKKRLRAALSRIRKIAVERGLIDDIK